MMMRSTQRVMKSGLGKARFMSTQSSFYKFSLPALNEDKDVPLAEHDGKVSLVVNVASLWGITSLNYPQLNALQDKYASKGFTVIGVPCNQFGLQENSDPSELLATLKHVRPGQGYEPNFPLYGKTLVNGNDAHEAYTFLKENSPPVEMEAERNYLTSTVPKHLTSAPVTTGDVQWNFEKFLVGSDGSVINRYTPGVAPEDIEGDISKALA
jgi:glutathione peroxidase